jgi:cobalamin 5'-phosphate synthase/cobalamin synthase
MIPKIFSGFALAFSMLTTLPFFKVHNFFKGINGYAVMFYPTIGLILGFILYGMYLVLTPYFPQDHLKLIIFIMMVVITGALHLDGVADTFDALFVPKERAQEVMKDPHIGAMGMIFCVVFLLFKASTLLHFDAFYLLPFIMMLSRFNAVVAIYFFDYIRTSGMSTLAKQEFTTTHLIFATISIMISMLFFTYSILLILSSLIIMIAFTLWSKKRFGGYSGDLYGFLIELTELILLNIMIVILL